MTKYILNSGGLSAHPEKTAVFFKEIVKGLGAQPKILLCLFSQPREFWEEKFEKYKDNFSKLIDAGIKPVFTLALLDRFSEQLRGNDAVMIYGGDDNLLQYLLRPFNLPELWNGKVVAGSSAGADILVKHFWASDWHQCMDGFGILPLKFIPHYKSDNHGQESQGAIDWDKAYQELAEYGDKSLPIYALEEGEFIVVEK